MAYLQKLWPIFDEKETKEKFPKLTEFMKFIVRERTNDVHAWHDLPQNYVTGRKVGKIPTNAGDVADSDRVGDMNYDDAYIYLLTTVAGTATWGRTALDTAW